MRSTVSLANTFMKEYDYRQMNLCEKEGLILDSYSRYDNDCRIILPSLNMGWKWGEKFVYSDEQYEMDVRESNR